MSKATQPVSKGGWIQTTISRTAQPVLTTVLTNPTPQPCARCSEASHFILRTTSPDGHRALISQCLATEGSGLALFDAHVHVGTLAPSDLSTVLIPVCGFSGLPSARLRLYTIFWSRPGDVPSFRWGQNDACSFIQIFLQGDDLWTHWKSSFVSESLKSLYLEAPPPSIYFCAHPSSSSESIMKLSYFSPMSLARTPQDSFVSAANWKV